MKALPTDLPDVLVLEPDVFGDDRGFFFESWNEAAFGEATGVAARFVQDNHSRSVQGVLRGLHYQLPQPQAKLVRCVVGAVWDVAVDIRKSSDSFGRWVGIELSAPNRRQLWIPAGFAHGFVVLTDAAELLYKTTSFYNKEFDRAIAWNDPELAIDWPLNSAPVLSVKDESAPLVCDALLFD
ncbi:MAG: dTDP-4-dehydrorhamnose 3,5-epimerase [Acidimicrobiia bacterium]|nr:dTDP-4-dehydrorhamnose 3,5-epimerase [Acidimicrobiia bacterium]